MCRGQKLLLNDGENLIHTLYCLVLGLRLESGGSSKVIVQMILRQDQRWLSISEDVVLILEIVSDWD